MKIEELEKIKEVISEVTKQLDRFYDSKSNKKYDCASIRLDENFMNFVDNGYLAAIKQMQNEINKQKELINVLAFVTKKRYPYLYLSLTDVMTEVNYYVNYYSVAFQGNKFGDIKGIFEKDGNFVLSTKLYQERIECLNDKNFYLVHKDDDLSYVVHYQMNLDGNFVLVHQFDNGVFVKELNDEIVCINEEDGNNMTLYNQVTKKVLFKDVNGYSFKYLKFGWLNQENLIRIFKYIMVGGQQLTFEFMVDAALEVVTDIICFDRDISFSKDTSWDYIQEYCDEVLVHEEKRGGNYQKKLVP